MMQACFELPTYGRKTDPFNATRYFWDALRDGFFAAVTCSWIMCLDESMVKWLGRGMPGFMHVLRKPTPMGLELHTLCCGICGILLWFEVWEGKTPMETKEYCADSAPRRQRAVVAYVRPVPLAVTAPRDFRSRHRSCEKGSSHNRSVPQRIPARGRLSRGSHRRRQTYAEGARTPPTPAHPYPPTPPHPHCPTSIPGCAAFTHLSTIE